MEFWGSFWGFGFQGGAGVMGQAIGILSLPHIQAALHVKKIHRFGIRGLGFRIVGKRLRVVGPHDSLGDFILEGFSSEFTHCSHFRYKFGDITPRFWVVWKPQSPLSGRGKGCTSVYLNN